MTSACDGVNRVRNTSPLRPSIAAATTERACTSRPALVTSQNTGASFTPVGKAEHGTALGNPRDCVSEAPASNYSTPRVVTTYGLRRQVVALGGRRVSAKKYSSGVAASCRPATSGAV